MSAGSGVQRSMPAFGPAAAGRTEEDAPHGGQFGRLWFCPSAETQLTRFGLLNGRGSEMSIATPWRAPSSGWRRSSTGLWAVDPNDEHRHHHRWLWFSRRLISLADTNSLLREQLSQSEQSNQALKEELHKLTADWIRSTEKAEQRETDWQREKKVCFITAEPLHVDPVWGLSWV